MPSTQLDWDTQCKRGSRLGVYAFQTNGRVGIANSVYREFSIEDECMWDPVDGQSFGEYYAEQLPMGTKKQKMDGPLNMLGWRWMRPCSGASDASDLIALGVNEESVHYSDYFFTRLHTRYTPAQATEELMLYPSNLTEQMQYRYIEYKYELEDRFPMWRRNG